MDSKAPPVLRGLRVLELAHSIAGQYLGQLLADQGADVLKAEPPRGARYRDCPQFHVWNRGKRSVTADLSSPEGVAFVHALASRADVLVSDFPAAEAQSLGLDYTSLAVDNTGLVHVWLPPYGEHGPFADTPPDDALASALGGIAAGQASDSGDPVFVTLPLASYGAALLASSAVVAALIARERDGAGQQVTVSWLAGALAVQTGSLVRGQQFMSTAALTGVSRQPKGISPVYRLYRAQDGWLFIACGNNVFFNKLCIALDRPELAGDERFSSAPWGIFNPEHRDALSKIIAPIIASRPLDDWLPHFLEHDVPSAPVLSRRDYIDDPQVVHNGLRLELEDPGLGDVIMAAPPISFSDSAPAAIRAAPALGEHTATALDAWPKETTGDSKLETRPNVPNQIPVSGSGAGASGQGPLAGVRVVDLTSYIAGSLCPMLLSDYGADVIKVESLEGDAFRTFGLGFLGWNRGKRGLALDLKSHGGREVLYRLAGTADVVVENFRAGVAARLGVDYEALRAVNPHLVYCTMAGWGETGPYAERPAFDPLLQARSGAMAAQGGEDEPVFLSVAVTDYAAAHLGAYAVLAALYARQRAGAGQRAVLSLTGATMSIQSGEFIFPASGGSFGHETTGSADFAGPSAACRSYCCSDGFIFIACTSERHWRALAKSIGRPELAYPGAWPAAAGTYPKGGIAHAVGEMLGEDSVERWLKRLASHGVPCAPVVALQDLLQHPQVQANALTVEHEHPTWGRILQTGPLARLSSSPGASQRVAPTLGQHTGEVLREIGYGDAVIAEFRERGVVA